VNSIHLSSFKYMSSINISAPLRNLILEQKSEYSIDCLEDKYMTRVPKSSSITKQSLLLPCREPLPLSSCTSSTKMVSSWLNTLTLDEFAFTLHKVIFRDAILSGMAGNPCTHQPCVPVVLLLRFSMLYLVQCVFFLPFNLMIRDLTNVRSLP